MAVSTRESADLPTDRRADRLREQVSDPLWLRYLFQRHSREVMMAWARHLRLFRFCRAAGGHANDGDTLTLALCFQGEDDLLWLLATLGITAKRYGPETPQPIPGKPYTGAEFQQFPSLVHAYPSIGQPSHVRLHDVRCHVWVTSERVTITIHSETDVWEVDEAAVARAHRLEGCLPAVAGRGIDPPLASEHCVCPRYYPEFWA